MKFLLFKILEIYIYLSINEFFLFYKIINIYIYIYTQKDKHPHTAYKMQRLKKNVCMFTNSISKKSIFMSHNFNITPILTTVLNMNKKTNTVTFISDNKRQVKDILFLFYNIIIRQNLEKKNFVL